MVTGPDRADALHVTLDALAAWRAACETAPDGPLSPWGQYDYGDGAALADRAHYLAALDFAADEVAAELSRP